MVRLKAKRTALLLYSVLLVLPTVVLGGLHWHQLWLDYNAELAAVPESARDAARRLTDGIAERLDQLLEQEESRPFDHYAEVFAPEAPIGDELSLHRSPLLREARPQGVLAWFGYDLSEGYGAQVDVFYGRSTAGHDLHAEMRQPDLSAAASELLRKNLADGFLRRAARLGSVQTKELPVVQAVVHRGREDSFECVRACMPVLSEAIVQVNYSQFHLRFYIDADGEPRALATRRVILADLDPELVAAAPCLEPLARGFGLVQGIFLDPYWLFEELPVWVSDRVLSGSERFQDTPPPGQPDARSDFRFPVSLVRALGFETPRDEPSEYGVVNVVIDKGEIESRFEAQSWRFFGVAAMLALTLTTGMVLLLRSVSRELEQATRTENFVAAVTHELRTPLSTIRLHGEMLAEGWVQDEDRRAEYYDRIVRETSRLTTLVERVLEKARLSARAAVPEPGDLSELVERLVPDVADRAGIGRDDLRFGLAPDLPPVMLVPEAVSGILDNLVENARKYAGPDGRPIDVMTLETDDEVVLEVADRGPGIPPEEAEHIFEAFYRVGNEGTRTSTGTGLGLHLVALHADSMGGRASVHPRPGGGALFRIAFQRA